MKPKKKEEVSEKEIKQLEKELKQLDKKSKRGEMPYIPNHYPEGIEFLFQNEWGYFLKDGQGYLYRLVWSCDKQQPVLQPILNTTRW